MQKIDREPEDIILQGKYKDKAEEDYMRSKLAEYYTLFPPGRLDSGDNRNIYDERCQKITNAYEINLWQSKLTYKLICDKCGATKITMELPGKATKHACGGDMRIEIVK